MSKGVHIPAMTNRVSEEISNKEIFHLITHLFQATVSLIKILSKVSVTELKELSRIPQEISLVFTTVPLAFSWVSALTKIPQSKPSQLLP